MKRTTAIILCGPMSGQMNGQSYATQIISTHIHIKRNNVTSCDTNGAPIVKLIRHTSAFIKIFLEKPSTVYISLNANAGMALSLALVISAKLAKSKIFIHHHTRSHLEGRHFLFGVLGRLAGRDATHISQCDTMSRMIASRLSQQCKVVTLSNAWLVNTDSQDHEIRLDREKHNRPFTIGHLSNLSKEKGLHTAIDCLRQAVRDGKDYRLVVAGPCSDKAANLLIRDAQNEFGSRFEWRGPVYGSEKSKFFSDIDVFVFPSIYRNETQGIVNLESLSFGVPVIAYNICCIGENLENSGSLAVPPSDDFVTAALDHMAQLPEKSSFLAQSRFCELREEALSQLEMIEILL